MKTFVAAAVLGMATAVAIAADTTPHHAEVASPQGGHHGAAAASTDHTPHPALSTDVHWAGRVVTTIGIMFAAAAVVGPLVRKEAPQEVPPAHSHDEPPGASGHHGHGGTHDLNPPEHGHHH